MAACRSHGSKRPSCPRSDGPLVPAALDSCSCRAPGAVCFVAGLAGAVLGTGICAGARVAAPRQRVGFLSADLFLTTGHSGGF